MFNRVTTVNAVSCSKSRSKREAETQSEHIIVTILRTGGRLWAPPAPSYAVYSPITLKAEITVLPEPPPHCLVVEETETC